MVRTKENPQDAVLLVEDSVCMSAEIATIGDNE